VGENTEDVEPFDLPSWIAGGRWPWRRESDSTVGSGYVEMRDVRTKGAFQLVMRKDQQVVETFIPHGLHPALREGVRRRCTHRRTNGLDAFGPEDLVEGGDELVRALPASGALFRFRSAPAEGLDQHEGQRQAHPAGW